MFGYQEGVTNRSSEFLMKDEGLNTQLTPVRNWMQPTVVEQGVGARSVLHPYPSVL